MSKQKGYRPAVSEKRVKALAEDSRAMGELQAEMLAKIKDVEKRKVTKAELKRDFGFTDSSLRLFEMSGWWPPEKNEGKRKVYDLASALRILTELPGLVSISRIRLRRKRKNVVSIEREVMARIARGEDGI